jgi:uncharacterized membrane protein YkoI
MTKRLSICAGLAVSLLTAGATGRTANDDEVVTIDQVPDAVRRTIESHLRGGTIREIERTTDHGRVLYEVDVRTKDGVVEFDVEADGTFAGYEDDGEEDEDRDGEEDDEDRAVVRMGGEGDTHVPTPMRDRVAMSPVITHPYFPLSRTRYTELRSGDERVVREVLGLTKHVGGVECLVLAEKEYEDGELAEISYNYFAQDRAGNVYYFGEDVDDFEDGRVVGHGGAWLVGKNATEPCLFMPATLDVGFRFKRENSPPDAEEWDLVEAIDGKLVVGGTEHNGLLVIAESDSPDRWTERKYYARGIGLVSENNELNLVSARRGVAQEREDDDEGDVVVTLDRVPPAVRRTIQAHLHDGTIIEIERTTDHGRVLFEVDVETSDGVIEFDVEADGTFVGYEDDGDEELNDEEDD